MSNQSLAPISPRGFHGALKATRVRLADRNLGGLEGVTDRLRIGATGVVELALLGDVVEVQRIGIGPSACVAPWQNTMT